MDSIKRCDIFFVKGRSFSTFVEKLDIIMVKSSEFHRMIRRAGKKRGWKWIKGEGDGSHRIDEDKDGIRYPVPFHGSKEMSEGLRLKIIRDMELE